MQKQVIGWEARAARLPELEGPVRLSCVFHVSGRQPDLKNLIALVEDALTGIGYRDDAQIAEYGQMQRLKCSKAEERTEITLEPTSEPADL